MHPTLDCQVLAVTHAHPGMSGTTTAVALALEAARAGQSVLLIDLSLDGDATRWLGATPWEKSRDIGSIFADGYPIGWARELAVPTRHSPKLWVIPASDNLSRKAPRATGGHLRIALTTVDDFDVVIIDCGPGHTDGRLTSALVAATDLVVVSSASEENLTEVAHVIETLDRFRRSAASCGIDETTLVRLRGIVVEDDGGATGRHRTSRTTNPVSKTWPEHVLTPAVPPGTTPGKAPQTGERSKDQWAPGGQLSTLYAQLAAQVIDSQTPLIPRSV
ncbi:ParA family protein [Georgenia sp. Marseille-Q6866]